MDACIVTSGTGNAFPKDTGNSQAWEQEIAGAFPRRGRAYRRHSDLLRFFRHSGESPAPAVFGIILQSLTRCFSTVAVPDVIAESQETLIRLAPAENRIGVNILAWQCTGIRLLRATISWAIDD